MNKMILMPLLLVVFINQVNADLMNNLDSRFLVSTCCSSCPQALVLNTSTLPTKYQNLIINSLNYNYNASTFSTYLRRLPSLFTKNLYNQIIDIQFRTANNYTSRGGVDTAGKSYSDLDQGSINFYFNSTKGVIKANMSNYSLNYINTAVNFLETARVNYNSMLQAAQQGFTLIDGSAATNTYINTFAMQTIAGIMSSFTNQEQSSIFNCIDLINNRSSTNQMLFQMPLQFPIQKDCFDTTFQNYSISEIANSMGSKKIYLSKNSAFPDSFCPIASDVQLIINSSNRRLTDANLSGNIQIKTFDIWFERRNQNEPSIFSPIYLDLFSGLNFYGQVYSPNNLDLTTLPNGGFGPNEDALQIWNNIQNKVFRSFLYYSIPGLKDTLQLSCPMTCDSSC